MIDNTFKASNVKELSFKICGYGYFPKIKNKIVNNFILYLRQAL